MDLRGTILEGSYRILRLVAGAAKLTLIATGVGTALGELRHPCRLAAPCAIGAPGTFWSPHKADTGNRPEDPWLPPPARSAGD